MIKIYFVLGLIIIPFVCRAQHAAGTGIQTLSGTWLLLNDATGKEMLSLSAARWDEYVSGTKYVSANLLPESPVKLYVEIADKQNGYCNKGVGFGCSIFDCEFSITLCPRKVDYNNRLCRVIAEVKKTGTVSITFIDEVDWKSLENNR